MAETLAVEANSKPLSATDDLRATLSDLRYITRYIQRYGFLTLVSTILNFGAVILSLSVKFLPLSVITGFALGIYLPISITALTILWIVLYEAMRKRGETLFEEVSDELQWNVRKESQAKYPPADDRPMLNARIALRSFARATDLPLVPGKYGPGFYATINFVMLFLVIFFFRVRF
jgi:hypothetical protein